MADPTNFFAEIKMFAGNYAPSGWAFCNGQTLPISQNTALFSLLGTYYGGDGRTTFALPDLRGRVPVHAGEGPGLTNYPLGTQAGSATVTLDATQLPPHAHALTATTTTADATTGSGRQLASPVAGGRVSSVGKIYSAAAPTTTLAPAALGLNGGSQPHNNMMPYLGLSFIIALTGIFPQRP